MRQWINIINENYASRTKKVVLLKDGSKAEVRMWEGDPEGRIHLWVERDGVELGSGSYDPEAESFVSIDTLPTYRRIGVATAIYDFLASHGYPIKPSIAVQPDGWAFWNARDGLRKSRPMPKLDESQGDYPLYHGTSMVGLFGIIGDDALNEDGRELTHGASLTYSEEVADEFAEEISNVLAQEGGSDNLEVALTKIIPTYPETFDRLYGAVIVFSADALKQRFQLEDFHSDSVTDGVTEEEVRIMLPEGGAAHPVKYAIKRIYLPLPEELDAFIALLGEDEAAHYGEVIAFIKSKIH